MIAWVRNRLNLGALWMLLFGLSILLSTLIVAPAYAATEYTAGPWKLVRSGITQPTDYLTHAACDAALRSQTVPIGSTITFRCQQTTTVRGVRDPQTCTAPRPADATRTQNCPAGTTGTWSQSNAYVQAPYPTCWALGGQWVPAGPPIGACVTPPPPPTGDWVHCANQEDRCEFEGTRLVRFGTDTPTPAWSERSFTGGVMCSSSAFGNPAPGRLKTCQTRGAVTPPEEPPPLPATGTASLHWTPPATMTDGTPATLAGYRIRYGRSPDTLTLQQEVANAGSTSSTVDSLTSGAWHFAVTAYDTQGRESLPSNTATKTIQ